MWRRLFTNDDLMVADALHVLSYLSLVFLRFRKDLVSSIYICNVYIYIYIARERVSQTERERGREREREFT